MNFIDLILSKDIKEYLLKIDYKFSINEVLCLIYNSGLPLKEKHALFEKMIIEYKDENVDYEEYDNAIAHTSYHQMAKDIIACEIEEEKDFCMSEIGKYVFTYSIVWRDNSENSNKDELEYHNSNTFFNTYEECLKKIKSEKLKYSILDENITNKEFVFIKIEKVKMGEDAYCSSYIHLNDKYEIINIFNKNVISKYNYPSAYFHYNYAGSIPTPFKYGDIVSLKFDIKHPILLIEKVNYDLENDIESGIIDKKEYDKYIEEHKNHFNVIFDGCQLWDEGKLVKAGFGDDYGISPMGYLSLEYYKSKDSKNVNMLINIKMLLEGKTPVYDVLNFYKFGDNKFDKCFDNNM